VDRRWTTEVREMEAAVEWIGIRFFFCSGDGVEACWTRSRAWRPKNSLDYSARFSFWWARQRATASFLRAKSKDERAKDWIVRGEGRKSVRDGRHRRERLFRTVQRQRQGCFWATDGGRAPVGSAPSRREKTHLEWCKQFCHIYVTIIATMTIIARVMTIIRVKLHCW
jgi:hypothetical protein